ncbi:DNA mismatch repair endonuclease MutL [Bacteroides acidifaciens]|uniref:DNA mismatch repair endonuclease MutL n=1 Tax=Bacteroides acidifaciens TaxID=85831 RepID=UPI00301504A7
MSDIIHLLPDSVANQIAAGEVIQRPASVIKELVENAVDASATQIDVVVEDAGRTSIQVVDNGKGMSETDARLSFERHATSKIREAGDLFALRTMGFRGEALASIAAVAQVELKTCLHGNELGTCVNIEGSHFVGQEPVSCAPGSNFLIRNLFFNVPARRKFLKSNQTELSNILQEFERVALVHEDISFSLTHNGSLVLSLPKSTLRQRIINIFGKKLNEQLLSVDVETSLVHLSGFVGKPESARKKGVHQYFFVNGRYMRHPYFHKAVMEAFEQLIPVGEQVSYFLYFDVEPANIDVNIHPTKTEIKFENELAIWQIIVAAIKESLGRFNAVPSIDFDMEGVPEIPVFGDSYTPVQVEAPTLEVNPDFNPFKAGRSSSSYKPKQMDWEDLYEVKGGGADDFMTKDFVEKDFSTPLSDDMSLYADVKDSFTMLARHYQYKGKYIMTAVKSGLMIIDQHRAHVRVLYDRYRKQMEGCDGQSQGLLFPEMLQLPPSESIVLEHLTDDLHALGFDLSVLGGGSFSINAVPSGTEKLDPVELVRGIVHSSIEKGCNVEEDVHHYIALSLARSAAIIQGKVLSDEEMEALVDDLFVCRTPNHTPDGKVIVAILEQDELDRLFG